MAPTKKNLHFTNPILLNNLTNSSTRLMQIIQFSDPSCLWKRGKRSVIESPRTRWTLVIRPQWGKGSGSIVENHAVDRFRSGAPPSGHVRPPRNAKKEGVVRWKRRMTRRERSIGLVKRFQACRYSGRFSSTLMKPITLRLAKGTPLIAGSRRFSPRLCNTY